MQQAILIIAHNNLRHIADMVRFFGAGFVFYIHLDKRGHYDKQELTKLSMLDGVRMISSQFSVHWGGIGITKVQLLLAEAALTDIANSYFHLISGQDIPIKKPKDFAVFFEKNQHLDFFEAVALPHPGFAKGGLERMMYYHLHDFLSLRGKTGRAVSSLLRRMQKTLGVRRQLPEGIRFFGGSGWWSVSRETLTYAIDAANNQVEILHRFRYCFASDEHFFPTLIMNSPHAGKLAGTNLRFIDWNPRHGVAPVVLNETDFDKLVLSEAFFARKISFPESAGLVKRIWNHLRQQ